MSLWAVFMTLCSAFLSSTMEPLVQAASPQDEEEVQPLLGLLHQRSDVGRPRKVNRNSGAGDTIHVLHV